MVSFNPQVSPVVVNNHISVKASTSTLVSVWLWWFSIFITAGMTVRYALKAGLIGCSMIEHNRNLGTFLQKSSKKLKLFLMKFTDSNSNKHADKTRHSEYGQPWKWGSAQNYWFHYRQRFIFYITMEEERISRWIVLCQGCLAELRHFAWSLTKHKVFCLKYSLLFNWWLTEY